MAGFFFILFFFLFVVVSSLRRVLFSYIFHQRIDVDGIDRPLGSRVVSERNRVFTELLLLMVSIENLRLRVDNMLVVEAAC